MRILLLADTHVPKRARQLPTQVWDEVGLANVVIHAGDWISRSVYDELSARSKRLIGVWGNNDGDDLRAVMPEVARVTLDGVRIAVVHETGSAKGRENRCAATFSDIDLLVFGHSHIPWDTTATTGLRLINPGSPTDRRRQPDCTYAVLDINDGAITSIEFKPVRPRS